VEFAGLRTSKQKTQIIQKDFLLTNPIYRLSTNTILHQLSPTPTMLFRAVTLFVLLASSASALDRVNLGTTDKFAILTKTGISTSGVTSVTVPSLPMPLQALA
jgi:hypothetical protein